MEQQRIKNWTSTSGVRNQHGTAILHLDKGKIRCCIQAHGDNWASTEGKIPTVVCYHLDMRPQRPICQNTGNNQGTIGRLLHL